MKKLLLIVTLTSANAHALKQISPSECEEMKQKVGQLFYINVDGFGSKSAIDPAYESLVKRMQPGGVLPHYNSKDITAIRTASKRLQEQSTLPLMIGIDYQSVNGAEIGLGYGAGLAAKVDRPAVGCFERIAKIEAALHQYAGINNPLGPTVEFNLKDKDSFPAKPMDYREPRLRAIVDAFRDAGLETTIKHYPYMPAGYNLHSTSRDTKIPKDVVDKEYMPIYKALSQDSGFLMTTHLYNSEVDAANMATFSKVWMKKLRDEVGFKGIAMTDALFMINAYPDTMKKMSRDWPKRLAGDFKKDLTIFTVKSILAGHDMVFLETASKETEETWNDVAKFACTVDPLAEEFRGRIRNAHERITSYKKSNPQLKVTHTELTHQDVTKLIAAKKTDSAVCDSQDPKLDAILAKVRRKETKIDDEVFKCESPVIASTIGHEAESLRTMASEAAAVVILERLKAADPDESNEFERLIASSEDLRKTIHSKLFTNARSGDPQTRSEAFAAIAKLDLLNGDPALIKHIMDKKDLTAFQNYLEIGATAKLVPVPPETPMQARLEMFQSFTSKHKIDLASGNTGLSLEVIQTLFPAEAYKTITPEQIKKISEIPDYGILLKFRALQEPGMALTDEEKLRFLDIYASNREIDNVSLPEICKNTNQENCSNESSFLSGIILSAISFPELNVPSQRKPDLLQKLEAAKGKTNDLHTKSQLDLFKVQIANDPTITRTALIVALNDSMELMKDDTFQDDDIAARRIETLIKYGKSTGVEVPAEIKNELVKTALESMTAENVNFYSYYVLVSLFPNELSKRKEELSKRETQ